jgi:hypothetical protein
MKLWAMGGDGMVRTTVTPARGRRQTGDTSLLGRYWTSGMGFGLPGEFFRWAAENDLS